MKTILEQSLSSSRKVRTGYVYILCSPNTDVIKIGGTDYPPLKRLREINTTEPYKSLGPWHLIDFRQVTDWRKTEYNLHYTFRSKFANTIQKQKELFTITALEASRVLEELNPDEIKGKPKIDRMFNDSVFVQFLEHLFTFTGILHWLDSQGAWTFTLFPQTSGGRYFTINIGPHEVAYTTLARGNQKSIHMILMDKLILDFSAASIWIKQHNGEIRLDLYASALPRSAAVTFLGTFNDACEFMMLQGVRRALVAYWSEALIELNDRTALSSYARFHNWNAIAEINRQIRSKK